MRLAMTPSTFSSALYASYPHRPVELGGGLGQVPLALSPVDPRYLRAADDPLPGPAGHLAELLL